MTSRGRSERESAWDHIVEENLREMKESSTLTYSQIADRMGQFTREDWSVSRTQDLFGTHQLREYKWREIVALADVFDVGILDIVMPNERRHPAPLKVLADRLGFPIELLTQSSRERQRRKHREMALVDEAILYHPELTEPAMAKSAMADLNEELRDAGPRRFDQIRADFAQQGLRYEKAMDQIRAGIRKGSVPNPAKSPAFQKLLERALEGVQVADTIPDPNLEQTDQGLWEAFWEVVWAEAAEAHAAEGSDVD